MALTMQDLKLAQDALAQDGRDARKAIANLERRVSVLEGREPKHETPKAKPKVEEKVERVCTKSRSDYRKSGKGWKYHRSWCDQH